MLAKIQITSSTNITVDLSRPLDISMPLISGDLVPNCFYAPPFEATPDRFGETIFLTKEGAAVNSLTVRVNPHGNGTHTECVGHIAKEVYTINQCLKQFAHLAQVITLYPTKLDNGDRVLYKTQFEELLADWQGTKPTALVLRTMPNDDLKLKANYSGANAPYLEPAAAAFLAEYGIEHLLLDLPSVDKEDDGGAVASHKAFWSYPEAPRTQATITELIYVRAEIKDGYYLLHHQIASFEIDASPSKPVLYALV